MKIESQDNVRSYNIDSHNTTVGINRLSWDGENDVGLKVGNGVYLFVIQADNKTVKKKIAVIR